MKIILLLIFSLFVVKAFAGYKSTRPPQLLRMPNDPIIIDLNLSHDYFIEGLEIENQQPLPRHFQKITELVPQDLAPFFGSDFLNSYELSTGANSQIYIIDSGIDVGNSAINHSIRIPNSFDVTDSETGFEESCDINGQGRGHGTHIAGVIAMRPIGDIPGQGICPDCNLNIVKFVNDDCRISSRQASSAFLEVIRRGANVVNTSWGIAAKFPDIQNAGLRCSVIDNIVDREYCFAIVSADVRGTVMVASAGNNNGTNNGVTFPANDSRVVAVGASTLNSFDEIFRTLQACEYFELPLDCNQNLGKEIEFSAPGINVASTMYRGFNWNNILNFACGDDSLAQSGYGVCTGTSMATPFITGAFGLMKSVAPLASNELLRQTLRFFTNQSCIDTSNDSSCRTTSFGFGVPQINQALIHLFKVYGDLTPLFQAYHPISGDYLYSISPQTIMAKLDSHSNFKTLGSKTSPDYPNYHFGISLRNDRLGEKLEPKPAFFDFYVFSTPSENRLPLYRLKKIHQNEYFYTTSVIEKNNKIKDGYDYLGTEGYLIKDEDFRLQYNRDHSNDDLIPVYRITIRKYHKQPHRNKYALYAGAPIKPGWEVYFLGYTKNPNNISR